MVTLLPASRADSDNGGSRAKPANRIRFALDAPKDASKVKAKIAFKFPSRKKPEDEDNG